MIICSWIFVDAAGVAEMFTGCEFMLWYPARTTFSFGRILYRRGSASPCSTQTDNDENYKHFANNINNNNNNNSSSVTIGRNNSSKIKLKRTSTLFDKENICKAALPVPCSSRLETPFINPISKTQSPENAPLTDLLIKSKAYITLSQFGTINYWLRSKVNQIDLKPPYQRYMHIIRNNNNNTNNDDDK